MEKQWILEQVMDVFETCKGNTVTEVENEFTMFDAPIMGIASAQDVLFEEYKKPEVIGPWFLKPTEWLPEAKTVVSIFFPFYWFFMVISHNFSCLCTKNICVRALNFTHFLPKSRIPLPAVMPAGETLPIHQIDFVHMVTSRPGIIQTS